MFASLAGLQVPVLPVRPHGIEYGSARHVVDNCYTGFGVLILLYLDLG